MEVITLKGFDKKFKKLPKKIQNIFSLKFSIFILNPFDVRLNNHVLHGSLRKYRSINITGDYRLIYEEMGDDIVRLIDINTHSQLYK